MKGDLKLHFGVAALRLRLPVHAEIPHEKACPLSLNDFREHVFARRESLAECEARDTLRDRPALHRNRVSRGVRFAEKLIEVFNLAGVPVNVDAE